MYRREAMKTIAWDMAEQFTFPVGLGAIEDVVSVNVTPKWEQSDDGQSIRLSGVYHIVASVQFNPVQQVEQVDGTYIEHIDLEHSTGYFEYALPLEVDLPSNKVEGPIKLEVSEVKSLNDTASCQFVWQVHCNFGEQQTALAEDLVKQEPIQSQVAQKEVAEQKQVPVAHTPAKEPVAKKVTVENNPTEKQVAHQDTTEHKPAKEQVAQQDTPAVEEVAQHVTAEHKSSEEHVAHQTTAEHKSSAEQVAQQEHLEHKFKQEEVAQQETVKQEPVKTEIAQQETVHQEQKKEMAKPHVAQLKVTQKENVQQEPIATQESSFKQVAVQKSPLQEDFFVELTDTYSVYKPQLNKIRS